MKVHVKIYLITLFSILALLLLNEVNLAHIKPNFPYKEGLITTADEYSYFSPADQFQSSLKWANNASGEPAYMRTPGYGIIYLIAKFIGNSHAFLILKIFQILFFAGSILLFSKLLLHLKISTRLVLFGTAIYGLLPSFSGFTYYTLSESVLPFFVLWSLYSFKVDTDNRSISLNVILSNCFLILIRPQLILLPLLFLLFLLYKRKKLWVSVLLAFIPLMLWNVRTISITGEWSGFHPIYSKTNNSLYREPHKEMTDLFRIWEFRGDYFHGTIALLSRDTTLKTTNEVLQTIPEKYRTDVKPLLIEFQHFRNVQQTVYAHKKIDNYIPGEQHLIEAIHSTRKKLVNENKLDYFIKTPTKSFKKLIFTSMMNLYVFQDPWRENWLVLSLKYFSFAIISLGFLCSCFFLIKRSDPIMFISASFVLLSIGYLCFVQRFNEERYLLPYLSILFIHLLVLVNELLNKKKATQKGSL